MTSRQIDLVQQSFRLIEPIIDDAAVVFYERLFEIDPSLQRLFPTSRRGQARLLAETLTSSSKGSITPRNFGAPRRPWARVMPAMACATSITRRRSGAPMDAREQVEKHIHVRGARGLGGGV